MNRLQRLFRSFTGYIKKLVTFSVDLTGDNVNTITQENALKIGAVFRCATLISGDISALQKNVLNVSDNNKANHLYDTALNVLAFNNMTAAHFFREMILSALVNGNGLALIHESAGNVQLEMLYPEDYEIALNDKKEVIYKVRGKNLDGTKVIHLFFYSLNGLWGESILTFGEKANAGAWATDRAAERILNRGGVMANYLTMQNPVNPDKAETMSQKFTQKLLNPLERGYPILSDGIELKSANINTRDIQLLENRKFNVEDICRFFGVPPVLAFAQSESAAVMESAFSMYFENCLKPIIAIIEQELTIKLFPTEALNTYKVKFNTFTLELRCINDKSAFLRTLLEIGIMNRNEIRGAFGFGDIPLGETYYITGQLRPDNVAETGFSTNLDNNNKA